MKDYLVEYPLLLLFIVVSLGYLLGNVKIKGNGLGVAAVLFTGLAFGAIDPRFSIPTIVFQLGLSIFVYSVGLSSGPVFFKAYKENGARDFLFAMSMLFLTGLTAAFFWWLFDFSAATITGVYSGSTTNTAALAGVIEFINQSGVSNAQGLEKEAVIGYTFSYPMGVLGGIFAIIIMEKLLKVDYQKELESLKDKFPLADKLTSATIRITNSEIDGLNVRDLKQKYQLNVSFGRVFQGENMSLVTWSTNLQLGDGLIAVGEKKELERLTEILGEPTVSPTLSDNTKYDLRRIFVSNPEVTGLTIASLNLDEKFDAIITRIRRGDVEMVATGETVLELGDRIRFIARREDLESLSKLFGDSYQQSSKVNLFSFGLGIGLGLLIGSISIPLGSYGEFKLGYAGGPLIAGLVLGALRRTGKIVWTMSYGSTITLQQMGLILLLASIGIGSGAAFIDSMGMDKVWVFLAGTGVSLFTALATLFVGFKIMKMPFSLLIGMVANQPAILDFAMERTGNRIPMFGFSQIFPIALIMKIVIAQILFIVLS
ncbi:MAG: putative transport protein [Flavobacteriales bacterium]|jgi:putative transport protein